jgi:two-component system chemotaxis response regulator CheB
MPSDRVWRNIVVLGASGGGLEALTRVLGDLPADLQAAVFVVLHTSPTGPALLAKVLARECKLPVKNAVEGEPITQGVVVVAPPDQHLLLTTESVALDRGPLQNRVRPAIDPLFRSAAVFHGAAVIGVVLSGSLSDGSAGLAAIKRCGGMAIVQSPSDALFPGMPQSAIEADSPDVIAPLAEIAGHIVRAVGQPATPVPIPPAIELEAAPGFRTGKSVEINDRIGQRAALSCPECGGPLWEIDGKPRRFRCQIGHAFHERVLLAAKTDEALSALQIAIRTLDERAHMMSSMAEHNRLAARHLTADQYMLRHDELRHAAETVRELLHGMTRSTAREDD